MTGKRPSVTGVVKSLRPSRRMNASFTTATVVLRRGDGTWHWRLRHLPTVRRAVSALPHPAASCGLRRPCPQREANRQQGSNILSSTGTPAITTFFFLAAPTETVAKEF